MPAFLSGLVNGVLLAYPITLAYRRPLAHRPGRVIGRDHWASAESGETVGGTAHARLPRRRRASGSVFPYQAPTVSGLGPG